MFRGDVSPARYVSTTRFALWSLTAIVITGGAVRLTGSGLGCSDWPNCEQDQLVASLEYHALIEFVNRLFTGVVTVAVVAAVLGSRRRSPRRRDLTRWSWGLVAGVVAQILLGAVLVKTDLDPRFTMGHFLLSMVLLWNAAVLHHRALAVTPTTSVADSRLVMLVRSVSVGAAVLLVSGTVVTGSGPHSGSDRDEVAERLPFLVRDVTRVHSSIAILVLLLVAASWMAARTAGRPEVERRALLVGALLVAQGIVGYAQYFAGVPVLLVAVHITLASLLWVSVVRLHLWTAP